MKKTKPKSLHENGTLLRLRNRQRTLILEELSMLALFMDEWFWQTVDMKDALHYKNPEYLQSRWKKLRNEVLGGPGFGDGLLQQKINEKMDGLLKRVKADIPELPETEYFAYSYFVAGFDNRMVAHLLKLKSAKIASAVKSRIKDEFLLLRSEFKFEYLELLPAQQLPNWQRNAIFA